MRPPAPVPATSLMSTPSSRAIRRTDGAAGAGGQSRRAAGSAAGARAAADVDDLPAARPAWRVAARSAGFGRLSAAGCFTPALSLAGSRLLAFDVLLEAAFVRHLRRRCSRPPAGLAPASSAPRLLRLRLRPRGLRDFAGAASAPRSPRRRIALDPEDRLADLDLVAVLDLDLFHHAGDRRRHFDGRLVGFELEDRLIFLERVARL